MSDETKEPKVLWIDSTKSFRIIAHEKTAKSQFKPFFEPEWVDDTSPDAAIIAQCAFDLTAENARLARRNEALVGMIESAHRFDLPDGREVRFVIEHPGRTFAGPAVPTVTGWRVNGQEPLCDSPRPFIDAYFTQLEKERPDHAE